MRASTARRERVPAFDAAPVGRVPHMH